MLAPQGARGNPKDHVVDHDHECDDDEQREPDGPAAVFLKAGNTDVGNERDGGDGGDRRKEEQDIDIARTIGDDIEESGAAAHAITLQVLHAPAGHPTDGGLCHDEQGCHDDQDDGDDHEHEIGAHRGTASQPSSNSAWRANIRSCSSGSA